MFASGGTARMSSSSRGIAEMTSEDVWFDSSILYLPMNLRFDTLQQPRLNIVKDRVVFHDSKILHLSLKLFIRVLCWASHRVDRHLLGLHLLVKLAGRC